MVSVLHHRKDVRQVLVLGTSSNKTALEIIDVKSSYSRDFSTSFNVGGV